MNTPQTSSPFAGRLLVVADQARISAVLRRRYPTVELACVPTYMSGIAELANGPVHAILAYVDPTFAPLESAVRGLRVAAGQTVPLVLCCRPEAEPLARKTLGAGASDYVICPPDSRELDGLLRLQPEEVHLPPALPPTSLLEMRKLGAVLEATTSAPHLLINRFAELLTVAIPARGAAVAAEGTRGEYGDQITEPCLREAIMRHNQPVGEILLGPPQAEGYSGADIDRLRHYAELFGHILHAAKRHHHWQHLALTDDLAALPNRRSLLQFVDRILERAAVQRFRVTLCMLDIDDFKHYNDEFGYAAGDEIIRAMGRLLRQHCRAEDMVARYGGDEFVVAVWDAEGPRQEGSEHPEQAIEFMKRFQAALRQHRFEHLGPRAQGELTVSGGLASYPWDASTTHALLDRANRALRDAKHQGKNRIHLVGTEVPRSV